MTDDSNKIAHLDATVDAIHDDVVYLRTKVDALQNEFHNRLTGIMWKVTSIGAGSGAVGATIALLIKNMV